MNTAVQFEFVDARAVLSSRWESGRRGDALPLVVALHDRGGEAATALADARRLFGDDADIAAPQAARPCNPLQSGFRGAAAYAGFSWYLGSNADEPEPASFGDALAQVLLFVADFDRVCVLHGRGQGAVLAVAASHYAQGSVVGLSVDEVVVRLASVTTGVAHDR